MSKPPKTMAAQGQQQGSKHQHQQAQSGGAGNKTPDRPQQQAEAPRHQPQRQ